MLPEEEESWAIYFSMSLTLAMSTPVPFPGSRTRVHAGRLVVTWVRDIKMMKMFVGEPTGSTLGADLLLDDDISSFFWCYGYYS